MTRLEGYDRILLRWRLIQRVVNPSSFTPPQKGGTRMSVYKMWKELVGEDGKVRDANGVIIAKGSVIGITDEWRRRNGLPCRKPVYKSA